MNFKQLFLYVFFINLLQIQSINCDQNAKKQWTILIHMAADNDLNVFAPTNIKQMEKIGSNENINIIVNLNIYETKKQQKTSSIIYIDKNSSTVLKRNAISTETDSGNYKNLIKFCEFAIKEYPSEKVALIFWNHGTGALDPNSKTRMTYPFLLSFDKTEEREYKETHYNSLLKSIKLIKRRNRGICFDSTNKSYINENDLSSAFCEITENILGNRKIDVVAFDACFMSMIEIATISEKYATIMIGSQEVEFGPGWDYNIFLSRFLSTDLSSKSFAISAVQAYSQVYKETNEFTQSAVDLTKTCNIKDKIKESVALLQNLAESNKNIFISIIKKSKNKNACDHYDEPDFIDLENFYKNLLKNINDNSGSIAQELYEKLKSNILDIIKAIEEAIIINKAGSDHKNSYGLSIYFPEYKIYKNYNKTLFCYLTEWNILIDMYLKQK